MNKTLVGLVAVLAVGLGVSVLLVKQATNLLGANAGPRSDFRTEFADGYATGGGFRDKDDTIPTIVGSDSASSTKTITAANVCDNTMLNVQFTTATGTLTLPTAANFVALDQCANKIGSGVRIAIRNSSSSGFFDIAGAASSTLSFSVASSTGGALLGTSTVTYGGVAELVGYRVTSGTQPWIVWTESSFR